MSPRNSDESRMCPSCKVRWYPNKQYSPNYPPALPIDRSLWQQLRQAAEAFDRRASNRDEEEGSSGVGDGRKYTAAEFIEYLKPDCQGYRDGKGYATQYEFDGVKRKQGHYNGQPFELPQASDGTRTTRGRAA